jgi:anti-sigma factor RsiW
MNDPILHPASDRLQAFVEGVLDAADSAIVESHLQGCAACQSDAEQWRSLFSVLATLPRYAPAPNFASRVMARVKLPDPWYVRAAARVQAELQLLVPKTTRGWAVATACLGLPMLVFSALAAWLLSKPYITPQGMLTFAADKLESFATVNASGVYASMIQSNAALYFARALNSLSNAGLGATGALFAAFTLGVGVSIWYLYQTLFNKSTTRGNRDYVSYCF